MGNSIVFGKGFLGNRIAGFLDYNIIGREIIDPTNVRDLAVFLDQETPSLVINAVGKTGTPNIDWCEENKEATFQSNVVAAINLSTECAKRGIYFVHLGSGCIYEGDNGGKGFSEKDTPNFFGPQFYAKSKIIAEKSLREFPGLILRIRMPIDSLPHPRNLIDKLLNYPKLIDVQNSMTTVPHMLPALKKMIDRKLEGVYNFVNPGTISPFQIMESYREIVDPSHKFDFLSLEELNEITKGTRSNCYLNTDKLATVGIILPEIHEAVKHCLVRYKESLK